MKRYIATIEIGIEDNANYLNDFNNYCKSRNGELNVEADTTEESVLLQNKELDAFEQGMKHGHLCGLYEITPVEEHENDSVAEKKHLINLFALLTKSKVIPLEGLSGEGSQ